MGQPRQEDRGGVRARDERDGGAPGEKTGRGERRVITAVLFNPALLYISLGHMVPFPLPLPSPVDMCREPLGVAGPADPDGAHSDLRA